MTAKIVEELAALDGCGGGCTLHMECSEDAYQEVCSVFTRLCPRLVPSPLWGISLARLARADPDVICSVIYGSNVDNCVSIVDRFRRWWFSLPRDQCRVCGSPANEVDEDWRYYIEDNTGIAVLENLVPLCEKCHLAKHLGYASVHGRGREALEHLACVNGVDIEVARHAARRAFEIHSALSRIEKWRMVLKELPEFDKDATKTIEEILNFMVSNGYSLDGCWLWYESNVEQKNQLEEKALEESEQLLRRVLNIYDKPLKEIIDMLKDDVVARLSVVEELRRILNEYGIRVLQRETELALTRIRVVDAILELGRTKQVLDDFTTCGKWIVFVPSKLRGLVLRRIIDELKKKNLNYVAKTIGVEEPDRSEQPVIIYVPSFLAVSIVKEVAEVILQILDEFRIDKPVMFKPDTFTYEGIYSDTVREMKSYIYITSLRLRLFTTAP